MSYNSGKKGPKVLISGYYGFDNCGDEAVLLAIVHCLKTLIPDIRIVVLSNNPKKTKALYTINAVNRWNPIRLALELISCRLLISGGGSLLQDVTSSKSLRYYLAIIKMAAIFRKKVIIYSQGIGPLNDEKNRMRVFRTLRRCHAITVRDERSAGLLKELGVKRDVQVVSDPVIALSLEDVESAGVEDQLRGLIASDDSRKDKKPLLMAAVRQWGDCKYIAPVAEFLDKQAKGGWDVLLVSAHYPSDLDAANTIKNLMTERPLILDKCLTAKEFIALTARADRVFSMRLHGLICAFAVGTPMIGLSYDPKVDAFMEQSGLSDYCLSFDNFDCGAAERLMLELDTITNKTQEAQETRRRELRALAWEAAEKAAALLG